MFDLRISRVKNFSDFFYIGQYQASANYFCVSSFVISLADFAINVWRWKKSFLERKIYCKFAPEEVGLHA